MPEKCTFCKYTTISVDNSGKKKKKSGNTAVKFSTTYPLVYVQ